MPIPEVFMTGRSLQIIKVRKRIRFKCAVLLLEIRKGIEVGDRYIAQ